MLRKKLNALWAISTVGLVLAMCAAFLKPTLTAAAVMPSAPTGQVSFTFDDGFASSLTEVAPVLAAHNQKATLYLSTGCVDGTGDCRSNVDPGATYLTWDQVLSLKNTYGWEIGAHTANHPLLTELTPAQQENEFITSNQAFAAHGLNPTAFATPYGDYNGAVVAGAAKYYTSHRGFHDIGYNSWPNNKYLLQVQQVQAGVSVATVKGYIDQAKANNTWLVLVFHDVHDNPSSDPEDFQFSTAELEEIAAYADAQNIKNVNVTEGLTTGQNNLVPNSGFTAGLSGGWVTDSPANVVADPNSHGNAPTPTNSVAMTSAADHNIHLFSPTITIDPAKQYWVSAYANMTTRTSGEFAVYVDEYNAAGDWVSGQYKQVLTDPQIKDVSFVYQASSAQVAKASVQFIVTSNSGITAYIDNVGWYSVEATTPDPDPQPTYLNLLPNSTFNNGVADGWSTDNPAAFSADSANNGSPVSPQFSVALTAPATVGNAHLFAPRVEVDPNLTYVIKAFLKILTLNSGEVAFYIDEYDSAGNWISGQYLFAKRNEGEEEIQFNYTPSSTNVRTAGLQLILTGNSGITGYLDEVQFLKPVSTPTPDPDPDPTPTTLLETSFESGLTGGWTTDGPLNATADSAGNGDPAGETQNSIKLIAALSSNVHVFSPQVNVASATNYTLTSYLNITERVDGEVAFYIDEYNASGNWISGRYLYAKSSVGSENVVIAYAPSSVNVASANLQVIVTGGSAITAYLDSVKWTTA